MLRNAIRTDGKRAGLALVASIATMLACATAASAAVLVTNIDVKNVRVERSTEQAGGHPTTKLLFEFCNQGNPIVSATKTAPIRITLAQPLVLQPGQALGDAIVRGAQGNTAANGDWQVQRVAGDDSSFDLIGSNGTSSGDYVPGSGLFRPTL